MRFPELPFGCPRPLLLTAPDSHQVFQIYLVTAFKPIEIGIFLRTAFAQGLCTIGG
ncbi:MAG: hypothetical protein K1X40_09235 [Chitinophagales bacterium]|nr:hypothetical protein [Chitinophagales bacterium]